MDIRSDGNIFNTYLMQKKMFTLFGLNWKSYERSYFGFKKEEIKSVLFIFSFFCKHISKLFLISFKCTVICVLNNMNHSYILLWQYNAVICKKACLDRNWAETVINDGRAMLFND